MCPTCSRRGYSSCTAQLPVARTCCERCHRPTPLTSQLPTMPLSTLPGADAGGWRWRPGAQLPTGAPGRTPPERCGNSNRAFWPPFSARCWTRRSVEPPPAREQQNRLPASYAQKASLRQTGRNCWRRMPPPLPTSPLALPQEKDRAGNERHPKPCTSARSRRFSLSLTPHLERCCRKVAMRRAAPPRLSPRVPTPECRTMSSESCCSADSAYFSRSPRNAALAGDSWTCTATTGPPYARQRARCLSCPLRGQVTQQTALKSHWGSSWRATSHQCPVDSERPARTARGLGMSWPPGVGSRLLVNVITLAPKKGAGTPVAVVKRRGGEKKKD